MSDHDRVRKTSAARPAKARKRIQAKLEVGAVDDPLETEAEATADRVMASIQAGPAPSQTPAQRMEEEEELLQGSRSVQRMDEEDLLQGSRSIQRMDEEDLLQGSRSVQRVEEEELMQGSRSIQRSLEEEDLLQGSRSAQRMEEEELQGSRVDRAAIGPDGGEVEPELEARLQAGSGSPLPEPVKSNMESAFGADFSDVRVGENPAAAEIGAQAYTTGNNIHFAPGQFKPDTPAGQHLLSHELTHVVQQRGGSVQRAHHREKSQAAVRTSVQRSATLINRWPWSKKKAKPKDPEQETWSGKAGDMADGVTEEIVKPAAAGAASAAGEGIGVAAGAGGTGLPVLSGLLLADAAVGLNSANKMHNEGQEYGDEAMVEMGTRKAKDQAAAGGKAAIGTSKAGVDAANMAKAATSLGAAAAGLGIAAGSVQVIQGAWRGGKAVMKLCRLTWGRGADMLSAQGAKWRAYVQKKQGLKAAINSTKVAVGALGIAAGALMLASNPIGWSIAIAAGVAGGLMAITKIASKIRNASAKKAARQKIEAGARAESVAPMDAEQAAPAEQAGQDSSVDPGSPAMADKRQAAIAAANEVARAASSTAATAHEMREALRAGNRDLVAQYVDVKATPKQSDGEFGHESVWVSPEDVMSEQLSYDLVALMAAEDKEFHDALMILSSINVDEETALSDSGQDLIAGKLNLTEAL